MYDFLNRCLHFVIVIGCELVRLIVVVFLVKVLLVNVQTLRHK